MHSILNFWEGYKTRIISFLLTLTSCAYLLGWITETHAMALGLLFTGGVATTIHHRVSTDAAKLLAKVERVETKVEAVTPEVARVTERIVQAAGPPASSGRP